MLHLPSPALLDLERKRAGIFSVKALRRIRVVGSERTGIEIVRKEIMVALSDRRQQSTSFHLSVKVAANVEETHTARKHVHHQTSQTKLHPTRAPISDTSFQSGWGCRYVGGVDLPPR